MIALKSPYLGLLFPYLIAQGRMPPADLSYIPKGFLPLLQMRGPMLTPIPSGLWDRGQLYALGSQGLWS